MRAKNTKTHEGRAGWPRSRLVRPTAIGAAVSLALSHSALAQWKPNAELSVKPGNKRSYGLVEGVVPFFQDARTLAFADLKFKLGTGDSQEFNLGAAYRRYLPGNDLWALGFYGAWDRRRSRTDNDYDQLTLGAEVRSAVWDIRANYYAPQTKKKLVGLGTSQFAGFGVFRNGVFEEAMRGYDVEVGGRLPLPLAGMELRAYLAAYSFKGADIAPKTNGTRVRLEFTPRQDWTIALSTQRDPLFGNATFLEVRYSFGKPPVTATRTLKDRMIDPWVRDIDVAISPVTESPNPQFWQVVQTSGAVHVDSSKLEPGDGSFERPYDTTAACLADKCAIATNNIIRLWKGNSSPTTPYTPITPLRSGQTLWGQGVDIFTNVASPGLRPVISGAADAVTLASGGSNFTVAGVDASSTVSRGIYGTNLSGAITIRDNIIQGANGGIRIRDTTGAGARTSNISITNNSITATAGTGVYIRNYASGAGASRQQTVTLSGNTVTASGNYGQGIYLRNDGRSNGTATQTTTISSNTVTASGYNGRGIYLRNYGRFNGTATQTTTISSNTVTASGNYGQGIRLRNRSDYGTAKQTVTISGNTVSATGGYGLRLYNYAYGGTATQNATVSGNTISGVGRGLDVYSGSSYYAGGTANQSVNLSGNTVNVTGAPDEGIYMRTYDGGTTTQSVTLQGDTINATTKVNNTGTGTCTGGGVAGCP